MVFVQDRGRGDGSRRIRVARGTARRMASPNQDRDSDRESLTDWTLVDREGITDKVTEGAEAKDDKGSGASSSSPAEAESKADTGKGKVDKEKGDKEKGKIDSSSGVEEDEGEEELSEDLISMGKRVQEIKGESFKDEGDAESLASSDVLVLDKEAKTLDEETDLSLASSPSLPDDLPAIKPDTQYRHTPDKELNSRLNIVVALTLACVLGLGLGHFLGLVALSGDEAPKGWSSRSLWQENLNSAQIIEALNLENQQLRSEIFRLQQENVSPIKISGKDGKDARNMREKITNLLVDNEELRVAMARQQFADLPDGDTKGFNSALATNYKLRLSVGKLTHLVPDLAALKVSANDLQKENQELQKQVGKLRYQEQPLPQELNVVAREVENLKKVVAEASRKKKVPSNYENAKIYLSYMSQVLQALHDFKEGGLVEKLDLATDVFESLLPSNVKPSASVQQKLNAVRSKFNQLRSSLASKWEKVKELSRPLNLAKASQDTLNKMNRVIVNVVNKLKDIGQASIMKRGKASFESTTATMAQSLGSLGDQLEKIWNSLEGQVDGNSEDEVGELLITIDEGIQSVESDNEEEEEEDTEEEADEISQQNYREGSFDHTNERKLQKGDIVIRETGERNRDGARVGGGSDGGDGKEPEEDRISSKITEVRNEEQDAHDEKQDIIMRNRMSDKEKKDKKQSEKAKEKEERAKKKKEREEKKSKNGKDDDKYGRRNSREEDYSNRKESDRSVRGVQDGDEKYHGRHYNNYKKYQKYDDDDEDDDDEDDDDEDDDDDDKSSKFKRKYNKKKQKEDDDDDDEDDDDDKVKRKFDRKKIHKVVEEDDDDDDDDKKKGLIRHWEKPSKKNYRREFPGPKKAFIRRRGKNATVSYGDNDREWMSKRAAGREGKRKEEQKADWVFERAKHRSHKREEEHKADWQFDRAKDRNDKRVWREVDEQDDKSRDSGRFVHNKHERRQAKRRYVRFDFDDDDDDDDYDEDDDDYDESFEFIHHHHNHNHQKKRRGEHKHHNKGKREWVIPNFSATGKTYYH